MIQAAVQGAAGRAKMAKPKRLNIALIGYSFMGKAHSHAFSE